MGQKSENTNLASEFYILSMLYRKGAEAILTLGNKKSIDILVQKGNKTLTIDVKGLKGTTSFPVDNVKIISKNHYLVFIAFLNRMKESNSIPEIYIVPSFHLTKRFKELEGKDLIYKNPKGNRQVIQLGSLRKLSKKYLDKWACFIK